MNAEKKRIILACENWHGATGQGMADGLRKLGWDVLHINTGDYFSSYVTRPMRALNRIIHPLAVRDYNIAIMQAVDSFDPVVFITIKGLNIGENLLQYMREKNVVSIMHYTDVSFMHQGVDEASFKLYSHFFTTKSFQLDYLSKLVGREKVSHLHHGYNNAVHYPVAPDLDEAEYECDVLYIGNHSPYKEKWLTEVRKMLPDIDFRIVNSRWRSLIKDPILSDCITSDVVHGTSYSRALQYGRINIALHFGPAGPQGWQDLVSRRTFEIPACKGFMLHTDNPEIQELYKIGEEIDVFGTPEELCEKIRYFLDRPKLRANMIKKAYKRCVPDYSYDERARVVSNWVELHRQK